MVICMYKLKVIRHTEPASSMVASVTWLRLTIEPYKQIEISGKPHRAPESMKFNCMPNAPCSGVFEISVSGKQTDIFDFLLISNLSSRKETDWCVVYFPGACVLIVFSFFCCFLFIFNT